MDVDVFTNSGFQLLHTAKHTPANPLVGEFCEPALDQVDPGTVSGSEVDMKAGALKGSLPKQHKEVFRETRTSG